MNTTAVIVKRIRQGHHLLLLRGQEITVKHNGIQSQLQQGYLAEHIDDITVYLKSESLPPDQQYQILSWAEEHPFFLSDGYLQVMLDMPVFEDLRSMLLFYYQHNSDDAVHDRYTQNWRLLQDVKRILLDWIESTGNHRTTKFAPEQKTVQQRYSVLDLLNALRQCKDYCSTIAKLAGSQADLHYAVWRAAMLAEKQGYVRYGLRFGGVLLCTNRLPEGSLVNTFTGQVLPDLEGF